MRKVLLLTMIVVLTLGFANVSAQDGYGGVDPSGVTLTYWHQYTRDPQLATMQALVEEFNMTNDYGITVELAENGMGYGDLRDQMNGAIISGELPNLVAGYQNDALSYYADDAALDLNPLFEDETYGFSEAELATLNLDIIRLNIFEEEGGVMLGWPNHVSASLQAVNLDMLAELGFEGAPETYEDFMAASCASAEQDGVEGYPITFSPNEFENFVASRGGSIYADGKWDFTGEASVATLQMYADLYNGCGYIPEERYQNTADFADLLNPMAQTSTAGIPFIIGPMEENGVVPNWTIATTPWTEGNRIAQIYVQDIIVIPATAEEEVASWLFVKFLATAENQIAWTTATSYFPTSLEAAASLGDFEAENPYFAAANAIVSDPDVTIYNSPQVISYSAVRGIITEGLADVTSNGRDVMDVAEEMTEKANEAHEDLQ